MAGYDQLDWQAYEPQAVLARWKRQEIREGRLTAGEDVEDDERCKKMCRAEIDKLKIGVATDPDAHFGPVVTAAHRERVENYIEMGVKEGAELVVDGRGASWGTKKDFLSDRQCSTA